ncbi:hypothetical protein [Alcanivorax quisquiliarum]|uniref:Uncharacterized protein n=1 Tax=Alcanivorax quisquiliarum TaxID=2933565 RepID=A0ABT0EB26_9GAMM|nr:hypothetical protein [Alcanivorax quisquiliarum]MCK0538827.1 hypothetical protein [Alcanivorax quisquiliarum]
MVSNGYDYSFFWQFKGDYIVREAFQNQASCTGITGFFREGYQRDEVFFNNVNGGLNSSKENGPEPRLLIFIPSAASIASCAASSSILTVRTVTGLTSFASWIEIRHG